MQFFQTFAALALLASLAKAQTPTPSATQPIGISSALDPTCPTITVTTGSTCPEITPVCIRPLCLQISTITPPCSCDTVPTVTSCATECGAGCATSTSIAGLPCPASPRPSTSTTMGGSGNGTATATTTSSMVVVTGAAAKRDAGRGGVILGAVGVVLGFL
ncbi:hypothetical protein IFR04_001282 [Cadophora malorum]|uniref:Uncharacterized protein n=1 Tax=Cadophora malorum TaxID=108018 RepID=A0A8H8BVF7_9HELO|nr:hypothetical protein IFR04_001282 [Cadophora malorum]